MIIDNHDSVFFPKTPPVIILGMHRSGTTMLTKLLAESGVFLGRDLDRNHESETFKKINEFLINTMGGNWDYPKPVEVLEEDLDLRSLYIAYIKSQICSIRSMPYLGIKNFIKKPSIWGWKDPRNTFTLNLWKEIYPKSKVIIIKRHGLDVAFSLMKRRQEYIRLNAKRMVSRKILYSIAGKRGVFVDTPRCYDIISALNLWDEYMQKANEWHTKNPASCIEVKFEEILEQPIESISKLFEYVGLIKNQESIEFLIKGINKDKAFLYKKDNFFNNISTIKREKIELLLSKHEYQL